LPQGIVCWWALQGADSKRVLLEVRDIGQAMAGAAHHLHVDRADVITAPALESVLSDSPCPLSNL
jgi:hypothetical protein